IPFVLRHRTTPQASNPTSSAARSAAPSTTHPVAAPDPKATVGNAPPAAPAPAAIPSKDSAPAVAPKASSISAGKGEVLDQATPEASAKALASIHGTVRVGVKVHVDAAGNVSIATLDSAGPSRYFADLSLKAARQWVFTPPETEGKSVPSDWKIQFHYTQSGVQMSSEQVAP